MKILKSFIGEKFDLAIWGLGFESRAISAFDKHANLCSKSLVIGYDVNIDKFSYQENKLKYIENKSDIIECADDSVGEIINDFLSKNRFFEPANVLLDITVMSRHRLACIICSLIDYLPDGSTLSVIYTLSDYIPPPKEDTPIKHLREIAPQLGGSLGDPSIPTSVIFGLGYEKSKALGVANFLDPSFIYTFIPKSPVSQFESDVVANNKDFLSLVSSDNIFYYDVSQPYSTYLDLKSLVHSLEKTSRPLLVPLGPKILAALSVFLGKELYPSLPVWRVSSGHTEVPIDRKSSNVEIKFTFKL